MALYIEKWFLEGASPYNINLGDDVSQVLQHSFLKTMVLSGTEDYGIYYAENGYRIGFSDNCVDEIGIDFTKSKCKVIFETSQGTFNLKSKKIHEVLNFLNDALLSWKSVESLDNNYLMVRLNKTGIMIIFDVYDGKISLIVKSNLMSA
jgi:hypothetical protein